MRMMPNPSRNLSIEIEGEPLIDVPSYLFHLLAAAARLREDGLDRAFQPLGLNASLFRALDALARFEPCTMTETAAFAVVDRTTATRMVDQLVRLGLVERIDCPADRRQVLIGLTELGRARQREAAEIVAEQNQQAFGALADDKARAAIGAMRDMVANLASDAEQADRLLTFRRPDLPAKCELRGHGSGEPARCTLQCRMHAEAPRGLAFAGRN